MSKDNVDRFLSVVDAFNRLAKTAGGFDLTAVQDFLGLMDREVQLEPQQAALEGGYVGHDGVLRWLGDLVQSYRGGSLDLSDVRDLGDEVLALGTLHLIGRGSGIDAEMPVALVASFRDGLVIRFKDYGQAGSALEAVGLSQ